MWTAKSRGGFRCSSGGVRRAADAERKLEIRGSSLKELGKCVAVMGVICCVGLAGSEREVGVLDGSWILKVGFVVVEEVVFSSAPSDDVVGIDSARLNSGRRLELASSVNRPELDSRPTISRPSPSS